MINFVETKIASVHPFRTQWFVTPNLATLIFVIKSVDCVKFDDYFHSIRFNSGYYVYLSFYIYLFI